MDRKQHRRKPSATHDAIAAARRRLEERTEARFKVASRELEVLYDSLDADEQAQLKASFDLWIEEQRQGRERERRGEVVGIDVARGVRRRRQGR